MLSQKEVLVLIEGIVVVSLDSHPYLLIILIYHNLQESSITVASTPRIKKGWLQHFLNSIIIFIREGRFLVSVPIL